MDIRNFSFGGPAAVVTSLGLIIGFDAGSANRATILGGLLIVAVADNLTDSLSIHMYQESEHLATRKAFHATVTNFATRLSLSLSFVLIMLALPMPLAVATSLIWGVVLLMGLTFLVAKAQNRPVVSELLKHLAAAAVVLSTSKAIGHMIVHLS
jgi:VIT1/CCC1 family predicted Fe2+/Mn2+ transporter